MAFLLDEEQISRWALEYCLDIEDEPEISRLITYQFHNDLYHEDITVGWKKMLIQLNRFGHKLIDSLENDQK